MGVAVGSHRRGVWPLGFWHRLRGRGVVKEVQDLEQSSILSSHTQQVSLRAKPRLECCLIIKSVCGGQLN